MPEETPDLSFARLLPGEEPRGKVSVAMPPALHDRLLRAAGRLDTSCSQVVCLSLEMVLPSIETNPGPFQHILDGQRRERERLLHEFKKMQEEQGI